MVHCILYRYFFANATYAESDESGDSSGEEEVIPDIPLDCSGNPRLPDRLGLKLKTQQLLVRDIFKKAYGEFTLINMHSVWIEIIF